MWWVRVFCGREGEERVYTVKTEWEEPQLYQCRRMRCVRREEGTYAACEVVLVEEEVCAGEDWCGQREL